MNRLRTTKLAAACSTALPAGALFILNPEPWLLAVAIVWVAAAWAIWAQCERRERIAGIAGTVRSMQTAAIRTMNHHRHDWMNELQVLYGYIRMQKTDKTIQCVEQIRERMLTESKIAKLGVPELIVYLQSFRTLTHAMELDLEIEGELNLAELSPNGGERAGRTIVGIIEAYRLAVKPGAGEVARLMIDLCREGAELTASFHYEGGLSDMAEWRNKCTTALDGSPLQAADPELEPGGLTLTAKLANENGG